MDVLKDYAYTLQSCNHCGQCKWILGPRMNGWKYAEVCPIHMRHHYDAYSGQGLISIARELLEGTLKYEDGLVELIYTCTTCGACDINCKSVRDMEVLDTILALRAKCVEDGKGPLPEHRKYEELIVKKHNIYDKPQSARFDWLPRKSKKSEDSGTVYFAGCNAAYQHPEIAVNTVKILEACGIDYKILGVGKYSCGNLLLRMVQFDAFQKAIEQNMDTLKR